MPVTRTCRTLKDSRSDCACSVYVCWHSRCHVIDPQADELTGNSEQTVNGNSKVYTPVSNQPAAPTPNGISHANHEHSHEMMHVDDTRDRVYIHDLDAELADIQSDEEQLVFLPDVEKKFSKLPTQVLTGRRDGDNDSQELVLYNVPESLTMEEGHDSVRKAIIESRHRAREKAAEEARQADMDRKYDHSDYLGSMETAHGYNTGYEEEQPDPDAMDIG